MDIAVQRCSDEVKQTQVSFYYCRTLILLRQ